jgi:hypothetical protein
LVNNRVESVRKKEKIDMFKIILLCFIIAVTMILSGCGKNKKDGYGVTPSSDISSGDNSNSTGSDQTQNGGSHQQVDKKDLSSTKDDVINIREKVFLAQINDIYSNFEDYKDKTIIVEGMFSHFKDNGTGDKVPVVYRKGPGCCGNDGWGGFLLRGLKSEPKENDWVKVTGKPILEKSKDGYYSLYLKVANLEVKKKRGAENVTQ